MNEKFTGNGWGYPRPFPFSYTETPFTDGEFGTLYRSFGYSGESAVGLGDGGNDLVAETDARGYVTRYEVDRVTYRNTHK